MADVDPALGQEILDVAQRQRVLHVHQHRQTYYLGRAVEIAERVAHGLKLPQPKTTRKIGLTMPRGEGRDDMNGLFAPFLLVGALHRFAVDGDHFGRRLRQRRRPRYETALERDRVEPGEDGVQLIVRGRAVSGAGQFRPLTDASPGSERSSGRMVHPDASPEISYWSSMSWIVKQRSWAIS